MKKIKYYVLAGIEVSEDKKTGDFFNNESLENPEIDTLVLVGKCYQEFIFIAYKNGVYIGNYNSNLLPKGSSFEFLDLFPAKEHNLKVLSPFEIGERLYHHFFGWITVENILDGYIYFLDDEGKKIPNQWDFESAVKEISFTEYNFITGGFTSKRPKSIPVAGTYGYFWNEGGNYCIQGYSGGESLGKIATIVDGVVARYDNFSKTIPLMPERHNSKKHTFDV